MDMVKQVIIVRRDLKMRRGKEIAQGSHGSMGAIFNYGSIEDDKMIIDLSDPDVKEWVTGSFAKITLKIDSLEAMMGIHDKAKAEGLNVCLIVDNGRTEFHGVPTETVLCIGPCRSSKIDHLTGNLSLL